MESIEERFLDILSDEGIDFILGLPCDRMKTLFSRFYEMPNYIPIAREEEGVGISAGISLGGKRPAMFVQSSGIGNMINALLSLTNFYKLPLPIFISHRGIYKEGIAAQIPMGKALKHILRGAGIGYTIISNEHHLSRIRSKLKTVFKRELIHAFLISPSLWEASTESVSPKRHRRRSSDLDTNFPFHIKKRAYYRRFDILKIISRYIRGRVVVSNLGVPSKELYRVCPQDTNFYMLGSMGMASPVG
ncbi:MAG: sulfopyruvate decarboxylase subunit alpha, partial [Nitrospirae bacterium]